MNKLQVMRQALASRKPLKAKKQKDELVVENDAKVRKPYFQKAK